MSNFRFATIAGMIAVGVSIVFTIGLRYWASTWSPTVLQWVFVMLVWTVIILIFFMLPLAYYFGNQKATGFLAGADAMFDNVIGRGIDAMERKQRTGQPSVQVPFEGDPYHRPTIVPALPAENSFNPNGRDDRRL